MKTIHEIRELFCLRYSNTFLHVVSNMYFITSLQKEGTLFIVAVSFEQFGKFAMNEEYNRLEWFTFRECEKLT